MMKRKAQLQIMENAFVLLVIFIILIIAFVFVIWVMKNEQNKKIQEMNELEQIKKSRVLSFLPEMQCSDNNNLDPDCYDMLKVDAFRKKLESPDILFWYKSLLGKVKISIVEYNPSPEVNAEVSRFDIYDYYESQDPESKSMTELHFPVMLRNPTESSQNNNYFGIIYLVVYE